MSDDGNRHDHPPTAGEQNFSENGSETTENDQSGLPPWAAAFTAQVTAQLQASFTAQLSANQEALSANQEALRAALEECSASARDARLASAQLQDQSAQLQDQRQEIEALQERLRVEADALTAEQAQAARSSASGQAIDFDEGSATPDARGPSAPPVPPGPPPKGATHRAEIRGQAERRYSELPSAAPATAPAATSSATVFATSAVDDDGARTATRRATTVAATAAEADGGGTLAAEAAGDDVRAAMRRAQAEVAAATARADAAEAALAAGRFSPSFAGRLSPGFGGSYSQGRATSSSFAFTGAVGGEEYRARKERLQKDLGEVQWMHGAPEELRDMLMDCLSDNGFAATYDGVVQNIRERVKDHVEPEGGLSPDEDGRFNQVLDRLRKALAAQTSPEDLLAALDSERGAEAITSPRLAVPFHAALQQAQSDGRTVDQAMRPRLTRVSEADGQALLMELMNGGAKGLIKTGTILLLRHLKDLADVRGAADASDDAKEDRLRVFLGTKCIKPTDYWTSHAKPATVLAWFRVAYTTMLRTVTTVTSTSAPDVFAALGPALRSTLPSTHKPTLAYWRDIHNMYKNMEYRGITDPDDRYTALVREVSEAYQAGLEDPPPESHCPASTFSDLPPLGTTTAAAIFNNGGSGGGGGGGGGSSGGGSGGGGAPPRQDRRKDRCERCRSKLHTSTTACPLPPPPADEAAAEVMKKDNSKFCVGKETPQQPLAPFGSNWDALFKSPFGCWKCHRWGHMTKNCPN
jgi:uncharacterized membrane protein YgcG